jgi:hypothetical protein
LDRTGDLHLAGAAEPEHGNGGRSGVADAAAGIFLFE